MYTGVALHWRLELIVITSVSQSADWQGRSIICSSQNTGHIEFGPSLHSST